MEKDTLKKVKNFSIDIRLQIIRQLHELGSGHLGGAMSMVDILSVLYGLDMKIDPSNPAWDERDLFVCSKGHAGPGLYATLALKGFFPMDWLDTLNKPGTNLPSHCDRLHTPGIDVSTGSLGQGVSMAAGLAMGAKLSESDRYVYCMLGDGESQEGQVWETALFAAQQKLDNFVVFLDYNKMQLDGAVKDINDLNDAAAKFRSFGWYVQEINGHDHEAIHEAIMNAKAQKGQPSAIIANTIKGYGCCFALGKLNHHLPVSDDDAAAAIAALEAERAAL